jgi:hypothetical protein
VEITDNQAENSQENQSVSVNVESQQDTELETLGHETLRVSSVKSFIAKLKDLISIETQKAGIRITPQGLFVGDQFQNQILKAYQDFLEKESDGEVHKSDAKCFKRLFGSTEPVGQYLLEGKTSIRGYLIPIIISNPQQYHLPYYLGSLFSMKDFVREDDPIIQSLSNVNIEMTNAGVEVKVKLGEKTISFEKNIIEQFRELALESDRVLKEFSGLHDSLAVSVKAISFLIRKSRYINVKQSILLPKNFSDTNKFNYRIVGRFVWVLSKQDKVLYVYELRGKNLYDFIRKEVSLLGKHIGSFEIFDIRNKMLGCFVLGRFKYALLPRAFLDFVEAISIAENKEDKFLKPFSIKECLEKFSERFQKAQYIDRHKIMSFISHLKRPFKESRIFGDWIFILGQGGVIEVCIAKFMQSYRDSSLKFSKRNKRYQGR